MIPRFRVDFCGLALFWLVLLYAVFGEMQGQKDTGHKRKALVPGMKILMKEKKELSFT